MNGAYTPPANQPDDDEYNNLPTRYQEYDIARTTGATLVGFVTAIFTLEKPSEAPKM